MQLATHSARGLRCLKVTLVCMSTAIGNAVHKVKQMTTVSIVLLHCICAGLPSSAGARLCT